MIRKQALLLSVVLLSTAVCAAAKGGSRLEWDAWQRLPVWENGRIMPLDTFARIHVKSICGSEKPWLALVPNDASPPSDPSGGEAARGELMPRRWDAAELLFSWLAEPDAWEQVPFLSAKDPELRAEILELPLVDETGRRLVHVSPRQVLDAPRFWQRSEQLARWERDGRSRDSREMLGLDKKVQELFETYMLYRRLTYSPEGQRQRFLAEFNALAETWNEVEPQLLRFPAFNEQMNVSEVAQQAATVMRKLAALRQGGDEQAMTEAREQAGWLERLASNLADQTAELPQMLPPSGDAASGEMRRMQQRLMELSSKTADVARGARKARNVLHYDGGESLWLTPALEVGPLEADRYRSGGQPWLSLQTLMYGSEAAVRDYPAHELREVREAYEQLLAVYRVRHDKERIGRVHDAMTRFQKALAALGEEIEPLRRRLPIREKDRELLDVTAYPDAGSTSAEVLYNQLNPFYWSLLLCAAGAGALALSLAPTLHKPMFWTGIGILAATQVVVLAGLSLRGYITGWFPLTGMFETFLVVALCVMLLGMVFTLLPRELYARSLVALAGVLLALLCLSLSNFVPTFHKEIEPPRAVLRSNFWLMVHVSTILASYGAAAMAWLLGNVVLGCYLFGRYREPDADVPVAQATRRLPPAPCAVLGGLIYKLIQVAVLMLAIGTILGGLWADVSWGRFWGWDSKEVWALISLLAYMFVLHLRHVGCAGHFPMSVGAVVCAVIIVWTWYGVNFIMSSGKHAYGAGSGGTWALTAFLLVNLAFLVAGAARYLVETGASQIAASPAARQP